MDLFLRRAEARLKDTQYRTLKEYYHYAVIMICYQYAVLITPGMRPFSVIPNYWVANKAFLITFGQGEQLI